MRHYRYDSQHRLIGITQPDGSDVAYRYDAFGRRIAKDMDGKTTQFIWQGDRLIAENIYQKGVKGWPLYRSYVYEPGTFKPMALLKGHGTTNEVYYYQLDHLGTPQELTDEAGKIVWSAYYRAYGNIVKIDINEISNPLRFQGQYYDEESGLHYNRHRYYNPNAGRYLTPDPIKLAGGLNSYQYVPNPTGWVDPLGLSSCPGEAEEYGNTTEISEPTSQAFVSEGIPSQPEIQYLYRGDTRSSDVIFSEGFKSIGESMDLELHIFDNNTPPSNFISTSTSADVAIDFGTAYRTKPGQFYILKLIQGRNVNHELGTKVPFPEEMEIAIPNQILKEDILGVTPVNADGSYVGYSIPNPAGK